MEVMLHNNQKGFYYSKKLQPIDIFRIHASRATASLH